MSLKDTLRIVREQSKADADFEQRKPQIIAEWQQSVLNLYNQIRDWLADYEKAEELSFAFEAIDIREESLGVYEIQTMKIHAGPMIVQVQPVGRVIIGGFGRVDMFRQGRSARDERILFIRAVEKDAENWAMRLPLRHGVETTDLRPLDRQIFEDALDGLLK